MRRILFYALSILLFSSVWLMTACAAQGSDTNSPPSTLIPFLTSTRIPIPTEGALQTPEGVVAAETPLPTPTPFTYTVQRGDTLSSIALKFGVSMEDLQTVNPEVSPNAMSVGLVINIPSNLENPSGEPTPTPAAFTIQQIACYPTTDRGMWCFVLVHNDFPDFMENLSVQVTLVDANDTAIASQTALLLLNILPPHTSLPLIVFFPTEVSSEAKPQLQVLTAIRLLPNDERYLPATLHNTLVQVNAAGRSARVNGQVLLPAEAKPARQVWVTGTAYDNTGRVVGARRWESNAGLAPGGSLAFEFMVSSLGGQIERVEFAVEARP